VLAGPHPEWFAAGTLEDLQARCFVVEADSDRVGLRLAPRGGGPLRRRPGELSSQGMVVGAVQVPPDGAPVVLGPDHATLGGYPVVAVVIAADRWVLGQCRPGDAVRFVVVDTGAAADALVVLRQRAAGAVVGTYPVATA
jgi:allophanate hydrolase subunit 2